MQLKPNCTLFSFSALTLLVESLDLQKPVPNMTCNVFGEILNLTRLDFRPLHFLDQHRASCSHTCICH